MYLYLREENRFEAVPDALLQRFGAPVLVMELELEAGRKLAREDTTRVMENLRLQGFHLQMPPKIHAELYRGD